MHGRVFTKGLMIIKYQRERGYLKYTNVNLKHFNHTNVEASQVPTQIKVWFYEIQKHQPIDS